MAPTQAFQSPNNLTLSSTISCNLNSSKSCNLPQNLPQFPTRRLATTAALATLLLAKEAIFNPNVASSFDFGLTVPDQTPEEAEAGVRAHARELLQIKPLIDSESWREAQKQLRESSPYLKQDLYTIIQAKPRMQRPRLRQLYSKLFNNVTKLDYAARSKDAVTVQECYENIVATLNDIFSII